MKKDNPLIDVTSMSMDDFENARISTMDELMEIPSAMLLGSLIASIVDPEQGNGRPACMKIKNNGIVVTLLIAVTEAHTIGALSDSVVH